MLQKGFTLIELMIVVAIIGILSMFALPAYQDYTKRTYVAEGLGLASAAKMAATEYYSSTSKWPLDNAAAGLPDGTKIKGQSVDSVDIVGVADGSSVEIEILYNEKVLGAGKSGTKNAAGSLRIAPTASESDGGSIVWNCTKMNGKGKAELSVSTAGSLQSKWLPATCRNSIS